MTERARGEGLPERQRDLILAVAGGDDGALGELYDLFERPLFSLGIRWLRDADLAEELVQEVIVRVWKGAGTFDPVKGQASSWIFGVARNCATDLLRAKARRPVPTETIESDKDAWDEDAAWRGWQIAQALSSLPAEQQQVVELAFINQCTHAEIARSLDVPLGTVKTRMYAGLKKLRDALTEVGIVEASGA
jgi:RNA polymerase sigma-70 factor (ECF subfamily)